MGSDFKGIGDICRGMSGTFVGVYQGHLSGYIGDICQGISGTFVGVY